MNFLQPIYKGFNFLCMFTNDQTTTTKFYHLGFKHMAILALAFKFVIETPILVEIPHAFLYCI